jgi:hypothetical protein
MIQIGTYADYYAIFQDKKPEENLASHIKELSSLTKE